MSKNLKKNSRGFQTMDLLLLTPPTFAWSLPFLLRLPTRSACASFVRAPKLLLPSAPPAPSTVHEKSLNEREELKKFQGSTFDTIARRRLIEDQDTILDLTGKIQELQNEINCMNDSRDFQDAESVRSQSTSVIPASSNS